MKATVCVAENGQAFTPTEASHGIYVIDLSNDSAVIANSKKIGLSHSRGRLVVKDHKTSL